MIYGLIAGHRNLGETLYNTLEKIAGKVEGLIFISNDELSTSEMSEKIKEICDYKENVKTLIFCDLYGGSCWRAAKMAKVDNCHILTGVNLPMLLSFINKRENIPFEELPSVLANDAKRGITLE